MKCFLLILALPLSTLCPGFQAWGNDGTDPEDISYPWASMFSEQHSQSVLSNKPLITPLVQSSLTRTFTEAQNVSPRVRDLLPDTARPQAKGLLATTTWFKGAFSTEAEIAHSQGRASWLQGRIPGNTLTTASSRMVRLGLTSTRGSFRYGLIFRTAGQEFLNAPDQTRREIWSEWKTGWVTLRNAVGQLWNNVSEDTTRARLAQTYEQMQIALAKASWPELSLTYTHNSLRSGLEPIGMAPQRTRSHTLDGALTYERQGWDVRLASQYILSSDLLRSGTQSKVRKQSLAASFRPANSLTIAPMLAYRENIQDWSGVHTESPSASLAIQYKRSPRLMVSGMAKYSSSRSSDGLIDNETLGGKGILRWGIQRSSSWHTLIAIEARYNRLTDHLMPTAGTEDISGLVRFILAAL